MIRGIKMSNSAEDTNLFIDILYDEIRLGCQLSSLWMCQAETFYIMSLYGTAPACLL